MQISQPSSSKTSLLIADDDADLLVLLRLKLQSEGFNVFTAIDSTELYAILQEQHIDVVLLDILINVESGAELCYELKHDPATAHIPVLLFSGHHKLAQLTDECGADGFLPKPVDIARLKKAITEVSKRLA